VPGGLHARLCYAFPVHVFFKSKKHDFLRFLSRCTPFSRTNLFRWKASVAEHVEDYHKGAAVERDPLLDSTSSSREVYNAPVERDRTWHTSVRDERSWPLMLLLLLLRVGGIDFVTTAS